MINFSFPLTGLGLMNYCRHILNKSGNIQFDGSLYMCIMNDLLLFCTYDVDELGPSSI